MFTCDFTYMSYKYKNSFLLGHIELTEKQSQFHKIMRNPETRVVFISGPAGTAKTFLSVYTAIYKHNQDNLLKILYLRSLAESADKGMGFLKGSMDDKFNPYIDKMFLSGRSEDVTEEIKKFAEESGVIFMCVSEEKGHWGSFELKDNFDVKKLVPKIVCPNVGLYHECLYGFLYEGKEVEVEFTGDTIGKTRTFY